MSEWQFASKEGILVWTSPAIPNGGQRLHSTLSPTLLLGYLQVGDSLPADYVKIPEIKNVFLKSATSIQIEREDDSGSILLVCSSEAEARSWHDNIQLAMGNSVHFATATSQTTPVAGDRNQMLHSSLSKLDATLNEDLRKQHQQYPPTMLGASPLPVPPQDHDVVPLSGLASPEVSMAGHPMQHSMSTRPMPGSTGMAAPVTQSSPSWYGPPTQQPRAAPVNYGRPLPASEARARSASGNYVSTYGGVPGVQTTSVTTQEQIRTGAPSNLPPFAPPTGPTYQPVGGYGSRPMPTFSDSGAPPGSTIGTSPFQESVGRPLATDSSRQAEMDRYTHEVMTNYRAGSIGSQGPAMRSKGRSGMLIDLPASQATNRSIAPNVSAVWKEWIGPDGCAYYFHEPTQTLQRLAPGSDTYETMVVGSEDIPEEHLRLRSHHEGDTTVNMNSQIVRNLHAYGGPSDATSAGIGEVPAASKYRSELNPPAPPRGQYSPTRRAAVDALTSPRVTQAQYQGQRMHRFSLRPGANPNESVIEHQVESLAARDVVWNPKSGLAVSRDPRQGALGTQAIHRQWEHVRKILLQGRYFKKHAIRTNTENYRFVFLTSDNTHVCSVPTSQVFLNINRDPQSFGSVTDTVQYFGPDTRALPVNSIIKVVMGTEESFVYRRKHLNPEATFVIVGETHALILESNTEEEARFFHDAWNFFLMYSKPVNLKEYRTAQMAAPVTHGTRTRAPF